MKIELLGALDLNKLSSFLDSKIDSLLSFNKNMMDYLDSLSNIENDELYSAIKNVIDTIKEKYKLEKIDSLSTGDFHQIISKLENILEEQTKELEELKESLINEVVELEKERKTNIVATAGRLSRYRGNVFEIMKIMEERNFSKNVEFAKYVINMGHDSITDHDYCVFALQDVSPIVEQMIIAERFSSFTVKSRREVDFSNVGFYTPDFHNEKGEVISNNKEIQEEYNKHMKSLFENYSHFVEKGIPMEDARFVIPYSYHSNIIMGVDAHTLKDMIIKFTKTKYSRISELKMFGKCLYEIAKEKMPYIVDEIDKVEVQEESAVDTYLNDALDKAMDEEQKKSFKILEHPKMLAHTDKVDDTILISAIMRRYQYDYPKAKLVYDQLVGLDSNFKEELMKKIAFEGDNIELKQVNFEFQIPISYAVLTHITRHRTHPIMVPDFSPVADLGQYKIPPKINASEELRKEYIDIFSKNKEMYNLFKSYGIRDEDLVYFTLSGNTLNFVTNFDGGTLRHILELRECSKAQWETQAMARGIHKEINTLEDAKTFSSILGSTCVTQGVCREGKESCGKVLELTKKNSSEKNKWKR